MIGTAGQRESHHGHFLSENSMNRSYRNARLWFRKRWQFGRDPGCQSLRSPCSYDLRCINGWFHPWYHSKFWKCSLLIGTRSSAVENRLTLHSYFIVHSQWCRYWCLLPAESSLCLPESLHLAFHSPLLRDFDQTTAIVHGWPRYCYCWSPHAIAQHYSISLWSYVS